MYELTRTPSEVFPLLLVQLTRTDQEGSATTWVGVATAIPWRRSPGFVGATLADHKMESSCSAVAGRYGPSDGGALLYLSPISPACAPEPSSYLMGDGSKMFSMMQLFIEISYCYKNHIKTVRLKWKLLLINEKLPFLGSIYSYLTHLQLLSIQ